MASSDMDMKQAETFLISQTRKHEGGITEDQSKALQHCWKLHRHRIHDTLVDRCIWNSRLQDVSWRIDIKSQSRNVEEVNTSTAIVEVKLKNSDLYQQVSSTFLSFVALCSPLIANFSQIFIMLDFIYSFTDMTSEAQGFFAGEKSYQSSNNLLLFLVKYGVNWTIVHYYYEAMKVWMQ
jgi:COMMD1 N-terminal domain/COMM domain